jgi:protein-S-isoprenylcysteine O-methyltransferase Ste14
MPVLALVAYLAFLVVVFGWRTWRQTRQSGDTGVRGFPRRALGPAPAILMTTGLATAAGTPVLESAGWIAPLSLLARPAVHAIGIATLAFGSCLMVVAQYQMGDSWRVGVRPGEPTALVTGAVNRRVRNPVFMGMGLARAGLVPARSGPTGDIRGVLCGDGL